MKTSYIIKRCQNLGHFNVKLLFVTNGSQTIYYLLLLCTYIPNNNEYETKPCYLPGYGKYITSHYIKKIKITLTIQLKKYNHCFNSNIILNIDVFLN